MGYGCVTSLSNILAILKQPVLLMEKMQLCKEVHRPTTYHWQICSHTVVFSETSGKQTHNFSGCKTTKRHTHLYKLLRIGYWSLTPLSTIFLLCSGSTT